MQNILRPTMQYLADFDPEVAALTAHHLDLGQLWHQLVWEPCPVSRSARRASLTPGRLRPPSPRAARMAA